MKRFGLIGAFVALLSLVSAQAQGPILPGPGLPVAASGLPIYTYLGFANQNNVATASFTFASFNVGTAASNRVIAVYIYIQANPAQTITSVSVCGNAATQATGAAGTGTARAADLWYVALTSGTSCNIVVTPSASGTNRSLAIEVAAIGTNTPTPGTGANFVQAFGTTANTNVTIPGGGVAFSGIGLQNGATATFSNMTVDDSQIGTGPNASNVYAGHQTVTGTNTATFASDSAVMSTVPWGP